MTSKSRTTLILFAVAAVIGVTAIAAAQASPLNPDPHQTGCDQTAVTVGSRSMYDPTNGAYIGLAQLRYSRGCETEWVTVFYNSGYYPSPSVWLQNQSGTDLYASDQAPYQGTVWTNQLPNMRYRTACGGVHVYRTVNAYYPSPGKWLAWFYIGCA